MDDRVPLEDAGTFMGIPASRDLSNSRAAVLGIPFDCGTHPTRIGSRLGPQAIRQHSGLVRRYEPPFRDYDPLARLGSSIAAMSRSARALSRRPSRISKQRFGTSCSRVLSR
jgi:hypothetical protein